MWVKIIHGLNPLKLIKMGNYKNHKLLTKKETNRLKHVGGPKSKDASKKQLLRMQANEEVLRRTMA